MKCSILVLQKEYKKDLENEIKGKGMELSSEVLDIQRAKRASEMASEVSGFLQQLGMRTFSFFADVTFPKVLYDASHVQTVIKSCLRCFPESRLKIISSSQSFYMLRGKKQSFKRNLYHRQNIPMRFDLVVQKQIKGWMCVWRGRGRCGLGSWQERS